MADRCFAALRDFLTAIAPLPEAEWEGFAAGLKTQQLAPGEALIKAGGSPAKVAYVVSGLLKTFYATRKGSDFIRNFTWEAQPIMALRALLENHPVSDVDMVAIEPSELIVFEYTSFRHREHPVWQQIALYLTERSYVQRERRQFELLTMTAEERVHSFFQQFPGLATRISQRDLASYVGITPESLSRVRAKIRKS